MLGDAWLDEGWVEFQLRKPVYPRDEVITTSVSPLPPEALGDAWLDEGWVEFQLRKTRLSQ